MSKLTFRPNTGKVVLLVIKEKPKKIEKGKENEDTGAEVRPVNSFGKVLATGGEAPWKDGDIVMFNRWQALEFTREGQSYILAKFEDILIIENETNE